ncbi:ankyrin repeat-containing domain protein, partial [Haematococcus lacustris]
GSAAGLPPALVKDWLQAAKTSQLDLLQHLLMAQPALLNVRGPGLGHTALHWAAAKGDTATVRWLLQQGAAPGAFNHEAATPLHAACRNGQLEAAQLLLRTG